MKTHLNATLLVAAVMAAMHGTASAAGYTEAEFTRLHKEVKILKDSAAPKEAAVGQKISAVTSVATGAESRAEMRFPDKSLTRLGANSRFTLRGEARTLDLDQGVLLLQVPEKILGAKVRTAAVTAAVTGGTVMFEYLPGGFVKLIVIEGYVDLFFNNNPANYRTYGPGEMIIGKFDEGGNANASLPDSVEVDLEALLKSSKLLSNDDTGAINQDLVNKAIEKQQGEIKDGKLVETNLVIPGRGTLVSINNNTRTNVFQNFGLREGQPPGGTTTPPGDTTTPPGDTTTQQTQQNPAAQGIAPLISGKTILNETSTIRTNPHVTAYNMLTGTVITSDGVPYNGNVNGLMQNVAFGNTNVISPSLQPKINAAGDWAMFRFEDLFINGTPQWITPFISTGGEGGYFVQNVILASDNGIRLGGSSQFPEDNIPAGAGGNGAAPIYGAVLNLDTVYPIGEEGSSDRISSLTLLSNNGDIILRGSPTGYAIYGYNQDVNIVTAGLSSDVRIEGNIILESGGYGGYEGPAEDPSTLAVVSGRDAYVANATVVADDVNIEAGSNVNISGGTISAQNGNLNIKAAGHINVTSTSSLKALLNTPEAMLRLESQVGNITITDSSLDSPNGTIELQANQGNIDLTNVTSPSAEMTAASVFRAQALGTNGWITIGGSNIKASTLIELFGGSAGGVRFIANSTLDSPTVNIGGNTVEIVGSSTVVNIPGGVLNVGTSAHPTQNHHYNRSDAPITRPDNGKFQIGSPSL